jgi:hypothetical protein
MPTAFPIFLSTFVYIFVNIADTRRVGILTTVRATPEPQTYSSDDCSFTMDTHISGASRYLLTFRALEIYT